ncbi:MAG: polysaccharide biosynthesis tyrosine autokinase [Candidatus Eremiobacteraeota bacterium]|nr:polysaccharide biosynthesis tyrosine autokinase [Candidatus Eremiobacteraeota bacterium]
MLRHIDQAGSIAAYESENRQHQRDIDLGRLWKSLVRRRQLFLGVFGSFVVFAILFTLLQPRAYTTSVKMIAGSTGTSDAGAEQEPGTQLPILNAMLAANGVQTSETYAELLQQTPVATEVARALGLNVSAPALLSKLKVKPVTDTAILNVSFTWKDPATSAKIANAFAAVFVDRERQLVSHQADQVISFLQQQIPAAEDHMHAADAALAAYQQRTGIADLPTQTQTEIANSAALVAKEQAAEIEARQAAASLGTVQAELAATPATIVGSQNVAGNPVRAQLEGQVATLRGQLDAARKQYTDDYPTVITLKAQLAEAQRELKRQSTSVNAGSSTVPNPVYQQLSQQASQLEAQVTGAQAQAQTLHRQSIAAKPVLDRLPEEARRITDLQRAARASESVYETLQRKYQDASISKTTAISGVSITQPASADSYSVTPNILLNIGIGIFVGLTLSIVSVLLAEFFDDRFRTEDDVKDRLGLPVLAIIPELPAGDVQGGEWVKPLSVESFYQLVASLRYSSSTPPHTIAFTSPDPGDGKSMVAVNTALSLAMMKSRVLIIDGDLRRPTVHQKLAVSNDRGLSDVLVGLTAFAQAVKPTEHAGVSVLTSGRPAPNPVALLQSAQFDNMLKEARDRFDFVIIDCPALRLIVDGVVLGIKADATVLVVSALQTEGRSAMRALEKLHGVSAINLLGIVLNRARPDTREQSNYYLGTGQSVSLTGANDA